MNWVGGARNRIRLQDDKKKQKEFFEKQRYMKKVSGVKSGKRSKHISQDLLSLHTVCQAYSGSTLNHVADKSSFPKKIDLDQHTTRVKCYEDLESPVQIALQFSHGRKKHFNGIRPKQPGLLGPSRESSQNTPVLNIENKQLVKGSAGRKIPFDSDDSKQSYAVSKVTESLSSRSWSQLSQPLSSIPKFSFANLEPETPFVLPTRRQEQNAKVTFCEKTQPCIVDSEPDGELDPWNSKEKMSFSSWGANYSSTSDHSKPSKDGIKQDREWALRNIYMSEDFQVTPLTKYRAAGDQNTHTYTRDQQRDPQETDWVTPQKKMKFTANTHCKSSEDVTKIHKLYDAVEECLKCTPARQKDIHRNHGIPHENNMKYSSRSCIDDSHSTRSNDISVTESVHTRATPENVLNPQLNSTSYSTDTVKPDLIYQNQISPDLQYTGSKTIWETVGRDPVKTSTPISDVKEELPGSNSKPKGLNETEFKYTHNPDSIRLYNVKDCDPDQMGEMPSNKDRKRIYYCKDLANVEYGQLKPSNHTTCTTEGINSECSKKLEQIAGRQSKVAETLPGSFASFRNYHQKTEESNSEYLHQEVSQNNDVQVTDTKKEAEPMLWTGKPENNDCVLPSITGSKDFDLCKDIEDMPSHGRSKFVSVYERPKKIQVQETIEELLQLDVEDGVVIPSQDSLNNQKGFRGNSSFHWVHTPDGSPPMDLSDPEEESAVVPTGVRDIDRAQPSICSVPISNTDRTQPSTCSVPISKTDRAQPSTCSVPISNTGRTQPSTCSVPISKTDRAQPSSCSVPISNIDRAQASTCSVPMSTTSRSPGHCESSTTLPPSLNCQSVCNAEGIMCEKDDSEGQVDSLVTSADAEMRHSEVSPGVKLSNEGEQNNQAEMKNAASPLVSTSLSGTDYSKHQLFLPCKHEEVKETLSFLMSSVIAKDAPSSEWQTLDSSLLGDVSGNERTIKDIIDSQNNAANTVAADSDVVLCETPSRPEKHVTDGGECGTGCESKIRKRDVQKVLKHVDSQCALLCQPSVDSGCQTDLSVDKTDKCVGSGAIPISVHVSTQTGSKTTPTVQIKTCNQESQCDLRKDVLLAHVSGCANLRTLEEELVPHHCKPELCDALKTVMEAFVFNSDGSSNSAEYLESFKESLQKDMKETENHLNKEKFDGVISFLQEYVKGHEKQIVSYSADEKREDKSTAENQKEFVHNVSSQVPSIEINSDIKESTSENHYELISSSQLLSSQTNSNQLLNGHQKINNGSQASPDTENPIQKIHTVPPDKDVPSTHVCHLM